MSLQGRRGLVEPGVQPQIFGRVSQKRSRVRGGPWLPSQPASEPKASDTTCYLNATSTATIATVIAANASTRAINT
jgi:hypothetical protein